MGTLTAAEDYRKRTSQPVTIGVDIGQRVDPSTICVCETFIVDRPGLRPETRFEVRHLERLPLGTGYPAVAARIAEVVAGIETRPVAPNHQPPRIDLLIDATGVGRPVVDIVRDALKGSSCRLTPVTFTYGDQLVTVNRELRLGKAFLVSRLQSLFQTDRVKLPANHPEAQAMVAELQAYEIKVTENANDTYGAFRTGAHDDLVTALGLAVLRDRPGGGVWGT